MLNKKYVKGKFQFTFNKVQLSDGGIIHCGHGSPRVRLNVVDMQQHPTIKQNHQEVGYLMNVVDRSHIELVCQFSYLVSPISNVLPLTLSWKVHSEEHLWEGPGNISSETTKYDNNYGRVDFTSKLKFKIATKHDKSKFDCRVTDWNKGSRKIKEVVIMVEEKPMSGITIAMIILTVISSLVLAALLVSIYLRYRNRGNF